MKVMDEDKMLTDTEKLLKECDAGSKTAVNSIEAVIDRTESEGLHQLLVEALDTHKRLGQEIHDLLNQHAEKGKEPNVMARSMAKMKIEMKMLQENSDHTVADLMIDGCNMGIKSLSEYINQYQKADKASRDIAARLVNAEQTFMDRLRMYL
ncbi:MAG: hypothetical protein IJN07_03300 [Clostridia bacterium]|nr:hypothetical protein [Clostridia bacterium]